MGDCGGCEAGGLPDTRAGQVGMGEALDLSTSRGFCASCHDHSLSDLRWALRVLPQNLHGVVVDACVLAVAPVRLLRIHC